ncbi:hypothetical protein EXN66_Car000944 [Channa argus]|uniref:Uncharacterized protein n=1 Tax=Channa argus TaxID=215402 RepID=A0A6G1QYJ4_CHAAH|nr:hypothetical protein EXN66_Car000944 [Channa argus]
MSSPYGREKKKWTGSNNIPDTAFTCDMTANPAIMSPSLLNLVGLQFKAVYV